MLQAAKRAEIFVDFAESLPLDLSFGFSLLFIPFARGCLAAPAPLPCVPARLLLSLVASVPRNMHSCRHH